MVGWFILSIFISVVIGLFVGYGLGLMSIAWLLKRKAYRVFNRHGEQVLKWE